MMKSASMIRLLPLTLAVAFSAANANAQLVPIDNFDDGNDKGWTPWFTHPSHPGEFDASSGCYRIQTKDMVPEDTFVVVGADWDGSHLPAYSNGKLRVRVRAEAESTNPGLALRWDAETGQGYVFVAGGDNGDMFILRVGGAVQQPLVWILGTDFRAHEDWIFEVGAIGESLSFKFWRAGDLEPASPQLTIANSEYTHGRFALAVAHPDPSVASQLNACYDDVVFIPACPADYNLDGDLNSQDFFDFLDAFFTLLPRADFNTDDAINSQDFFDFLDAFFVGCA